MKIALVHDFLIVWGGAERVLKDLHTLYPDAPIFLGVADPALVAEHFPKADIRTSWLNGSWRRKVNQVMLMSMPRAVESYDLSAFDVVFSSSGAFSHGVITGPQTHHISYCHSPMRYAWDWHAEFAQEKGFNKNWLMSWLGNSIMHNLRTWDAVSAKRVDTWVANAKTVQARIKRFYRAESLVINPPVDTEYFNPELLTEKITRGNHMLSVSRISGAKKIDQMIEACAKAQVELRIAGAGDPAPYRELAGKLNAKVVFLGEVSEEVKRRELASAAAFLFPAEDDFGIAPVEAMAMGTPVIAFGKGGATETVVQGTTGILYPEQTSTSLALALQQFAKEGVKGSPESIRKRSLLFSTEKFKESIRELVEKHA